MKQLIKVFLSLGLLTRIFSQWTRNGVPVVETDRKNRSISAKIYSDSYMESCTSPHNKLLSNLYVDYFRTSGPCKMDEDAIIYTFQKHKQKMSSREAKKTMDELCKSLPVLCEKDKRRNGRFFLGLGQKLADSIQHKLFKMFSKFNGYNYHGYHFPPLLHYPLMHPNIHSPSAFLPLTPHISHAPPPLPPPIPMAFVRYPPPLSGVPNPPIDPYYHGPMIYHHYPSSTGYLPLDFQHLIRGSSQKNPPLNGNSCESDNSCRHKQNSLVKSASDTHNIVKRGVCEEVTDVVFPMIGRTMYNNSTVKILQDFTNLIQPVFYKLCRTENAAYADGRCIQEFLPVSFFVYYRNPPTSQNHQTFPQEFVLVESGCKFREQ